jgi:hypothetical protein
MVRASVVVFVMAVMAAAGSSGETKPTRVLVLYFSLTGNTIPVCCRCSRPSPAPGSSTPKHVAINLAGAPASGVGNPNYFTGRFGQTSCFTFAMAPAPTVITLPLNRVRTNWHTHKIEHSLIVTMGRSTVPDEIPATPGDPFWLTNFRIDNWPTSFPASSFRTFPKLLTSISAR